MARRKSVRICASVQCGAEAVYGAWCMPCQRETDPHHLAIISWDEDITFEGEQQPRGQRRQRVEQRTIIDEQQLQGSSELSCDR